MREESKEKITGGATIWARQTIESDIFFWKPDKWFKIWFYIVNRVNHKDTKLFKCGSAYIEYKEIALKTKATHGEIQSFLRWAKKMQMLSTQKSTRGNIITVNKYRVFQDFNNYSIQARVEAQSKHNPSTIHAINNNDKNEKNTMYTYPQEFLDFWNEYPKKKEKVETFKEWKKINPSSLLKNKIIKSVRLYKETKEWKKDNGQFIIYPVRFLKRRKWEDEIELTEEQKIWNSTK